MSLFPRPSSFLRTTLLAYIFLIIYASLYPFSGWKFIGGVPWSLFSFSLPRYWTWFDCLTNVIGYIPLGILLVTAIFPLLRGFKAFLFAVGVSLILSVTMEVLQSYLSSRVPSNLDLLANVLGGSIGGVAGTFFSPHLFKENRAHYFIQRWLRTGSSRVLIIPILWPFAQIYPQNYLFGQGNVLPLISECLSVFYDRPVNLSFPFFGNLLLTPEQYWLSETIITATGLSAVILILFYILKKDAPRILFSVFLLFSALLCKVIACALFFDTENALVWLTPGAKGGILVGLLMLAGLVMAPSQIQRRVAIYMLLISIIVINILPENQYFLSTLQTWKQGRFLNFNGAAYFLSLIWPFLSLGFLFRSIYNRRYSE